MQNDMLNICWSGLHNKSPNIRLKK